MKTVYLFGYTENDRDTLSLTLTLTVHGIVDSLRRAQEMVEMDMREELDDNDPGGPGEWIVEEHHLASGRPGVRWFKRSINTKWEKWDPANP